MKQYKIVKKIKEQVENDERKYIKYDKEEDSTN